MEVIKKGEARWDREKIARLGLAMDPMVKLVLHLRVGIDGGWAIPQKPQSIDRTSTKKIARKKCHPSFRVLVPGDDEVHLSEGTPRL